MAARIASHQPAVASLLVLESVRWCPGSSPQPLPPLRLCAFGSRGALLLQSLRCSLLGAEVEADGYIHLLELNLPTSLYPSDVGGGESFWAGAAGPFRAICMYRCYGDSSSSSCPPSRCLIGRRTSITMIDSNLSGDSSLALVAKVCFAVQSKRVRLDLIGFLSSALPIGASAVQSKCSRNNNDGARSLLVVGPHGAGAAEVVEGAMRSITDAILGGSFSSSSEGDVNNSSSCAARGAVRILHVRPSLVSAVGKEDCEGYLLHVLNLACALAQRECVLVLLHDVDLYLPRSDSSEPSAGSIIVKAFFQFLSKLKQLGHLQLCIIGTAPSGIRNAPFDAVVELENITFGDKVVAARMLVDSVCASNGKGDARSLNASLGALLSTSRPQSAGLSSFLRSCQDVFRGMESTLIGAQDTKYHGEVQTSGLQLRNICGQSALKASVREALIFPRQYSSVYKSFGIQPPSGILMYGPPGTGKTLMAKEIARELRGGFFTLKLNEVVRGHVGEGERALRSLMSDAKASAPCVVFIDEFQSIFTARGSDGADEGSSSSVGISLTASLAAALDDVAAWNANAGSQSLITVLAASNEPWAIDSAFLRPGRLDRCVFVGPLDAVGVEELILTEFELFSFVDGGIEVDRSAFLADVGARLAGKYTGAQLRQAVKGVKLRHVREQAKISTTKDARTAGLNNLRIDIREIMELVEPLRSTSIESSMEKYRYFESSR